MRRAGGRARRRAGQPGVPPRGGRGGAGGAAGRAGRHGRGGLRRARDGRGAPVRALRHRRGGELAGEAVPARPPRAEGPGGGEKGRVDGAAGGVPGGPERDHRRPPVRWRLAPRHGASPPDGRVTGAAHVRFCNYGPKPRG